MKKNEIFKPVIPKDRNEFIAAVETGQKVIYIEGTLFKDVIEQLNSDVSKRKSVKWFIGGGFTVAWAALWCIPGIGWILSALAMIISGILTVDGIKNRELKKYSMGFSGGNDEKTCERIILVHQDYSFQHDSITDNLILSDEKKRCPKCKSKVKKSYCPNCQKNIVIVGKVKSKLKN